MKKDKYIILYADEYSPESWEIYCNILGADYTANAIKISFNKEDVEVSDDTYGCDQCGERYDWETEIEWLNSGYGVCYDCIAEMSEDEINWYRMNDTDPFPF